MRNLFGLLLLLVPIASASAAARWEVLPPTPAPVAGEKTGHADVNGIKLFYATVGDGAPVVLLHGGLANSDYWGNQVKALVADHHEVILVDSRGHGRSTRNDAPYGYDLMADDVLALLDTLKIKQADIVGWSDGGIVGLDLAMRHPDRVGKIFAFAANSVISGVKDGFDRNPTFAAFIARGESEYGRLSATPKEYQSFLGQIGHMWESQPNWTDGDLKKIKAPVLIADGDHDEAIKREHTEYLAAAIPGAGLLILPNTSHFAFLQNPGLFNAAMLNFLNGR
jgi:pimeloyl-ACP methyl ester carboxylesterase